MSELSSNKERPNLKNKTHDIQGGEKKVMKKSLKVLASATLAFSLFASVAMAAETTPAATTAPAAVKTSKDFKDLAGLDAALTAKIDALLAKGYMDGKGDNFDVTGNMTRAEAAKLVAKIFGLTVGTETTSSFKDVDGTDASIAWSIPFIEAAKKAGIIDGMTDTTFAPKDNVTLGQLATLLVKGFGKGADVKTTTPWYQGYLDVAKANNVDLGTDGAKLATRADLVVGSFAASAAVEAAQAVTADFKATGAKKFTVTFNKAVDTSKAVIAVKNGTNAVNTKSVTFSDDKKTATVEFPYALAAADYTVSVTGLGKDLTGTVKVEAEKVTKINFNSDKAVLVRGDLKKVKVGYKVFNQYNEEITSSTSLTATTSAGTIVGGNTVSGGTITIDNGSADFKANDPIAVSLIHTNGTFASATVTVGAVANVSAIEIKSQYQNNTTKSDLQAGNANVGEYNLVLEAKDQYGNSVTDTAVLASDLLVTVSNTAVVSVAGYTNNAATFANLTIDGSNKAVLTLAGGLTAGTSNVTLISKSTGAKSSFDVVVKDSVKVDNFTMTVPALAVAAEETVIPFTALDQFNKDVAHPTAASFTSVNTTSGSIVFEKDVVANKTNMKLVNPSKGTVIITIVTKTNKVQQLTVNVVDAKVPTVVSATKDFSTSVLKTGTVTIGKANIVVKDQYGRDMTPNWGDGTVAASAAPEYRVVVESGTVGNVSVSSNVYVDDTNSVVLTGAAKGTSTITLKLEKATDTAAFAPVANGSYTYTQKVVENADIASYEATVSGTVYNDGASATYGKDLVVTGILADGSKVTIPSVAANYDVISSNAGVVYTRNSDPAVAGKITAANFAFSGTDTSADAVVTVVVKGATTQTIPVTVKVSKATPAIQTLSLKDKYEVGSPAVTVAKKESDGVVSALAADVDTIGELEAVVEGIVKSVDQYGVEIAEDFAQANIIVSNLTVASATKDLAHVATGDTFNVTAIIGSKVISFKVIVK
ncbi:S-layer homology domain-containing protein [Paenibacillus roseipurpureus]|uniref:S-layer homology domain-containing protein n=1 Tax=Paenibacillus roseopurpureus TaxID=2918901 RepID=A0AA96RMU2_9BACL|nr:S-layer homology domain-containing protein [Paenibacillus sp. MBLB1832]WNR44677.1 S-layer homology domain-containing protein [Paenibacillus sp. MBLB1832]